MKWKKLIRKMVSSQLINQAFRPPSFSKTPAFKPHKKSVIVKFFPHLNKKLFRAT
jgi:hypothetical protein